MRKLAIVALAVVASAVSLAPLHVAAQTGSTITLSSSANEVVFGRGVTLSGTIAPPQAGLTIQIRGSGGSVVAAATSNAGGAFSATIWPEATDDYVASTPEASSEPVHVSVRATATIRSSPVRLFDTVTVRGTIAPARPGQTVVVSLFRRGRALDRQEVAMGASGSFVARFPIPLPGTYRARASFSAADLLRATAVGESDATPLPRLSSGDRGIFVRLLESRLAELGYRLAASNDAGYDHRTAEAVVAFHKVQRMARSFVVGAATWRRLAEPRVPRARHEWRGFHFEVDQTLQVLYAVRDGEITDILHVSTGAGGATYDGSYRVFRKIAGYSPNRLYYPSYFHGLRALHGWPDVPTYPASHGCVRIPYWNAQWVYRLATYGTRVVIYHS